MKQILAMFTNGTEQFEFRVGISLGLNDTVALTITIGLDLKKDMKVDVDHYLNNSHLNVKKWSLNLTCG